MDPKTVDMLDYVANAIDTTAKRGCSPRLVAFHAVRAVGDWRSANLPYGDEFVKTVGGKAVLVQDALNDLLSVIPKLD